MGPRLMPWQRYHAEGWFQYDRTKWGGGIPGKLPRKAQVRPEVCRHVNEFPERREFATKC